MLKSSRPPARAAVSPRGPGGRPFSRWRPAMALLAVGTGLVGAVLLMSDRAPGLLRQVSARIDSGTSGAARLASETRPQSDFEIHVVVWATITVFVCLAMWSNRSVLLAAVCVLATSVVAERAQEVLTVSREMQLADVIANTIGVLAGLGAVTALAILMRWNDSYPGV